MADTAFAGLVEKHQKGLLKDWLAAQKRDGTSRDPSAEAANADLARQVLDQLSKGAAGGRLDDTTAPEWAPMREVLEDFSRARATQGFQSDRDGCLRLLAQGAAVRHAAARIGADAEQLGRLTGLSHACSMHWASTPSSAPHGRARR